MTARDVSRCSKAFSEGSRIPRPPSRAGRPKSDRISGPGEAWPVSEGKTVFWRTSSISLRDSEVLSAVRHKYVQRLTSPCVRAQKARCGWTAAILANRASSSFHLLTRSATNDSENEASPSGAPRCRTPLVVMFRPVSAKMVVAS